MQDHFENLESFKFHLEKMSPGTIMIEYRNCEGYPGMVLGIMIVFDLSKSTCDLDLQWMSFGLDPYGDTLQESYVYRFDEIESLMAYLEKTYKIGITDIPLRFQFDSGRFPDPIKNEAEKPVFKTAWQQFQSDFGQDKFLDPSLNLVFDSRK